MATSMAASTVPNAVLLPSKDAAYSSPAASRNSSLRIPYKPAVGILGGKGSAVGTRRLQVVAMASPPPKGNISDEVAESIKKANEICLDPEKSGECAAEWDIIEELSATSSDLRQKEKEKGADPLENFCKDNPDSDECRTYDS